jgi:hypothetical protein
LVGGTFGGLSAAASSQDIGQGMLSGAKGGAVAGTISGIGSAALYANKNNVNIITGKPNPVPDSPLKPLPIPRVGVDVTESTASAPKQFRTEPQNLQEQLTLQEAQSGQGNIIMQDKIADPKWSGHQKMQHSHLNLNTNKRIVIHFWNNPETGNRVQFKFKNR